MNIMSLLIHEHCYVEMDVYAAYLLLPFRDNIVMTETIISQKQLNPSFMYLRHYASQTLVVIASQ